MPFNSREFDIVKAAVSRDTYRQEQHPDDAAVADLAAAMKVKLSKQRAKGYGGWDTPECTQQRLSDMLREHVDKGDPVDVANFCAFLAARGEGIAQAAPAAVAGPRERDEFEAYWAQCNAPLPMNNRLRDDGRYGDHMVQAQWEAWQARAAAPTTQAAPVAQVDALDTARSLFDAGWKACARFCDCDDAIYDGIVGSMGCPEFETAFEAVWAAQQDKS